MGRSLRLSGPSAAASSVWRAGIVVLTLTLALASEAATLDDVRIADADTYTRVVLDLSGTTDYHVFTLAHPNRVVVDLSGARPRAGFKLGSVPVDKTRVSAVRGAPRGGSGYRLVLDMGQHFEPRHSSIPGTDSRGSRVVIDLFAANAPPPGAAAPVDDPPPASAAPSAPAPVASIDAVSGAPRDFIVAIDAGHGGGDPGAIGVGKVQEKRVAMAIAQELNRLFDAARGYRGVLVRRGDYYLTLRQRTEFARRQRADLFVSIHADAFMSAAARGASVYTLSEKGATSETARWLAEKENASDLIGGVGDVSLDDKDATLRHVLLDLSMDANRSASIETGNSVLASLGRVTRLHRARVEQAGFVVLKSPDIPSILVETGYLSNAAEARALAQSSYQRRIARAVFDGITQYVSKHPPADTWVARSASTASTTRHVIRRGDTLSEIAAQYNVSSSRLKEVNGLANDMIRVGQVLIIPAS
jgi:N-acetylmuramoyl-L-alanine amidase